MIYLIGQLSIWLFLTAAFAAVAGWAFAAQRAAPKERALHRERDNLLRDISRIAGGESPVDSAADERELDALRRQIEVRDGRIAELEHALEAARARADEAASRIAELERGPPAAPGENEEMSRLRALVTQHEDERARELEVTAEPVQEDEAAALTAWRLRYFEQRVRYLEGLAAERASGAEEAGAPPLQEWRAREASVRADFLEQEVRALSAGQAQPAEAGPFAADAEVDKLMRWRLLYLERRVAHLQEQAALAPPPPIASAASSDEIDPDRWKWRARYLEARVRHLQQGAAQSTPAPAAVAEAAAATAIAEAPPERPSTPAQKPPTLAAARNGAPDDFTLIEDVSVLQQTTLYSLGVFHFDQVASWTPANVAWVDQYLRLRGRIEDEQWVEQAKALADRGVGAARRILEAEEA